VSSNAFMYTLLPWNFITKFQEGVVVQKDGLLQRTFAYRAPDADSSSLADINDICIRVNDFSKRLGAGWAFFVEAQRFYIQDYPAASAASPAGYDSLAGYLIDREREESFSAAGKHFESSYYITFAWKPPVDSVKQLAAMFIQSSSGTENAKTMKENVEYFVSETDAVVGLLSASMLIEPLNNEQTVLYLHSSISLKRHNIYFPYTQILLDRILPDTALENTLTLKLGDYYIPIIGINDFPEDTYPAILEPLNRTRMEYRWVSRWICLDKTQAKNEAQKKEKSHRGNQKTVMQTFAETTSGGSGNATVNHGAAVKESDSIAAGVEIDTDVASLGYYTSCVMVWDKKYETAKKKAETIRNIINTAGFTCKEETFGALDAWKSMMPGQVYANYRSLPVMSYNLSHILPLSSVWSGMRVNEHAGRVTGVDLPHITCGTLEGTPFYFNLNPDSDVGHTSVVGPTGAGKSTFLNTLTAQMLKYTGSQIITFDKDRSCRQLCLACGGLFYEPAAENAAGVAFQPLRDLETDRDIIDAMDFIESLITVNGFTVSPQMRAAIKMCLDLLRDKDKEDRTITSFIHYVNYLDPETKRPVFKDILGDYLWAGGKYGKIFDSRASGLSIDTRYLAIEMGELMNRGEACVVPALVYLFNLIEKKFDGRLTLLVLDEAWLFLKNEMFAEKITEWLKVLRKKNVFVVFATQEVADVEKSPLKTTIIQQCLTKIYLADPSALTAGMIDVYRAFGLTDTEIALIASARMKRDYFYTSPLGRRLFQLDLGRLTLAFVGSPDHKLLDRLLSEHGFGIPLCREILKAYGIDFKKYLRHDAPHDKYSKPLEETPSSYILPPIFHALPPLLTIVPADAAKIPASDILDAAAEISNRHKKGQGRAAELLAKRLQVSPATVYQARSLLRHGGEELITRVRNGELTIKAAYKSIVRAAREEPENIPEAG